VRHRANLRNRHASRRPGIKPLGEDAFLLAVNRRGGHKLRGLHRPGLRVDSPSAKPANPAAVTAKNAMFTMTSYVRVAPAGRRKFGLVILSSLTAFQTLQSLEKRRL
jgi:hypothetical protein